MPLYAVRDLLAVQHGVVSRRQLLTSGFTKADLDRMIRRRELRGIHPGVLVDHTGPPTVAQRRWAAVLYAAPSALHLGWALQEPVVGGPVDVAIDHRRAVREVPGVRVHRVRGLDDLVRWQASPPRVRAEEATLELAHRATSELQVVQVVTDVVRRRITTAARLREALHRRPRIARRRFLERLLRDVETGVCSVLEHAYLVGVERAHGLPASTRQVIRAGRRGREYRDAEYQPFGLVVELDGEAAHAGWAAGERDAERDLADRAAGREVVRLRYGQVLDRPCATADGLARILLRRGWSGPARGCGPGCPVDHA